MLDSMHRTHQIWVVTAHKRGCGKVMFSKASFCSPGGCSFCDHYLWCKAPPPTWHMGTYPPLLTSDIIIVHLFKLVHLRTNQPTPNSGNHWNMYRWQAGNTHPTGMISCYCPQTKLQKCNVVILLHLSVILFTGGCTSPRQTSPPQDGPCSGRYASYWNAFFLWSASTPSTCYSIKCESHKTLTGHYWEDHFWRMFTFELLGHVTCKIWHNICCCHDHLSIAKTIGTFTAVWDEEAWMYLI